MNEIVLNNEVKSLIFRCGRKMRPQVALPKSFIIVTKSISKQLKLDIHKYNSQYKNLKVTISSKYHDRFLIIDKHTFHIGASLKDLGKKVFAFSKIDIDILKES